MPISRDGKMYYTEEQYRKAKANNSALEYALKQGYHLIPVGTDRFIMKEHDSMVFLKNGQWFWNSQNLHGRAIEFIMSYEGKSLQDAVLILSGAAGNTAECAVFSAPAEREPKKKSEFMLPQRAPDNRRLFYYLCNVRGLEKTVVQEMIRQKIVYQSRYFTKNGQSVDNACFVSYDKTGKAVGAYQRGMLDNAHSFKGDFCSTDKSDGWLLRYPVPGVTVEVVEVYEGAIDAASGASLIELNGRDWLQSPVDRLSLEGCTNYIALESYIEQHPAVRHIVLLLDNDPGGRKAANELEIIWSKKGYTVTNIIPGKKDINECLIAQRSERKGGNHGI